MVVYLVLVAETIEEDCGLDDLLYEEACFQFARVR